MPAEALFRILDVGVTALNAATSALSEVESLHSHMPRTVRALENIQELDQGAKRKLVAFICGYASLAAFLFRVHHNKKAQRHRRLHLKA